MVVAVAIINLATTGCSFGPLSWPTCCFHRSLEVRNYQHCYCYCSSRSSWLGDPGSKPVVVEAFSIAAATIGLGLGLELMLSKVGDCSASFA